MTSPGSQDSMYHTQNHKRIQHQITTKFGYQLEWVWCWLSIVALLLFKLPADWTLIAVNKYFFIFILSSNIHSTDVERQGAELLRQKPHIQRGQYLLCLPLHGNTALPPGPRLTSALFICLQQQASAGTVFHVISDMMLLTLTGIMLLLMMMSNSGQSRIWQSCSTDTFSLSAAETEGAGQCGLDGNGPIYLEVQRLDTCEHGSVILV